MSQADVSNGTEDDAYKSELDEDYNPDLVLNDIKQRNNDSSDSFSGSEEDEANYKTTIKTSVKTRSQRQVDIAKEKELANLKRYGTGFFDEKEKDLAQDSRIGDVLEKLNHITKTIYKKTPVGAEIDVLNNRLVNSIENIVLWPRDDEASKKIEMITIKRTYKFAGKIVAEDITVPKNSAMAEEYLQSLKFKDDDEKNEFSVKEPHKEKIDETPTSSLRKPLKRQSLLLDIISGNNSNYTKISTLDKSKMDWANYVDSQRNLKDTLESGWKGQKGGFLERKNFLERKDVVD